MNSFANMEQLETGSSPAFWNNYLANDVDDQPELSAANLHTFAINSNIMDPQFTNASLQDFSQPPIQSGKNENFIPANQSTMPSESLSMSSDTSVSNVKHLNSLVDTINKTQQEVVAIKKELNEDYISSSIDKNSGFMDSKPPQHLVDKRKSQNRAAQRAFRERKEQKLRQLEKRLEESETEKKKALAELESLKLKNIIITTENQMLAKNSAARGSETVMTPTSTDAAESSSSLLPKKSASFTFPDVCVKTLDNDASGDESFEGKLVYKDPELKDEKLLNIAAAWDYVSSFEELNPSVEIDIATIMSEIEGTEKCHGFGPAYPLTNIQKAICNQVHGSH